MRRFVVFALSMAMMLVVASPVTAGGTTQIDGVGVFDDGDCDPESDGVDPNALIIRVTGDLDGCLYQYFESGGFHNPDGETYLERGTEIFVSSTNPADRFETTYTFTGKFRDQNFDDELWGRCQHPMVAGSGEGVFEGATGRLDFKDVIVRDPDTGEVTDLYFPLRGHIKYSG